MAPSLPKTYKAAVFKKANEKLTIEDVELRQPEEGQVLIKVLATGVCHSDAMTQSGVMGSPFPIVPGHEMIGDVMAVGPREKKWKVGDRVGVCKACNRGLFQMCENETINGVLRDGGYAEYCLLRSEATVSVPSDIDPAEFCPLLCAGVTVFNSMKQQHIHSGDIVAIQGLGGLGHLAVQYASKMGYRTVALSSSGSKEKFARELGAHEYIDGSKEDHAEALQRLGGASLIVSTVPDPTSLGKLINGLGIVGKLLILAPCGEVAVDTIPMIGKGLSVTCWPSGHALDSEEAIAFARLHDVKCLVEKFPLDKANEAFEHMMSGKARFRAQSLLCTFPERKMNDTHERIVVPSHTPKPLPYHLRTELTSALLSESAIPMIQSALSDGCRDAGWLDAVLERAKQLIRSGDATTWQEAMDKLAKEARGVTDNQPTVSGGLRRGHSDDGIRTTADQTVDKSVSIKFPERVMKQGTQIVRNALENIVEIENTDARG
ncbi:MAG: hypothetical protein L6R37_007769 [Teloschistes peruensis]|nr:MAG: hypothetical protein L6R37_007769 [Teloschistes peruensis]